MSKWYNHNEGGKALVIFEEDDLSKQLDTVSISMLVNNKIPCLVPASFSQVDETRYIKFNISSRIAFREFLERPTTFGIVSELLINMCNSFIELRKYMIDGSALIFDTDKMYIDTSLTTVSFILEPLIENHKPVKYNDFFKKILFSLQMTDNENLGAVVNMLNGRNFSLERFSEQLGKLKNQAPAEPSEPYKPSPVHESTPADGARNDFGDFADRQLGLEKEKDKPEIPAPAQGDKSGKRFAFPKFAIPGLSDAKQSEPKPQKPTAESAVPPAPSKPETPAKKSGGLFDRFNPFGGDKGEKGEKGDKKIKPTPKPAPAPMGDIAIPGAEPDHVSAMSSMSSVSVPRPEPAPRFEVPIPTPTQPEASPMQGFAVPDDGQAPQPEYFDQMGGIGGESSEQYSAYPFAEQSAGRMIRTDESDDDTTELMGSEDGEEDPRLERLSTGETIDIDKDTFNIGKDPKALLDYIINDKRISRRHASIIHRNGNYFIVDLGSKNHTYVNGNMLISNMEQILNNGDKIRIAVEEFIFRI